MEAQAAVQFPKLEVLRASDPHVFIQPAKLINEGPDVSAFLSSKAYRDIGIFILQLNRAMCPRKTKGEDGKEKIQTFWLGSASETQPAESVRKLQEMLSKIMSYIDQCPPDTGPRRFGNVSFRNWYQMLEENLPALLREHLPPVVYEFESKKPEGACGPLVELTAYLLGAFGSSQRLDYGTGHELSFLAFLGCLWKLGAFEDGQQDGEIERNIVLGIFEPYLRVVRRLILTYTLEPAGSHGVWGLDDHSHLPYLFGSAQLSRAITENEATPLEGSLFRGPKPGQVVKADIVEEERKRSMYFSAIGFINDVKKGPFWEHSRILFDISGIRDGWGKINKGMIKMYNAEVLSKFPVVQHFPFGSLFSWDQDPDAAESQKSVHLANQPTANANQGSGSGVGTAAPWAQASAMPPPSAIPYSSAPGGQVTARPPPQAGSIGTRMPPTRDPRANPNGP